MSIIDKYNLRAEKINSLVCVGLDSEYEKLPAVAEAKAGEGRQFEFNKKIIEQTHEYVAAYKPNIAFYEARGDEGLRELKQTMDYLHKHHPDVFTICDAKRGDIGNTNNGYITSILDWMGFDAMTINPYMGKESLLPFLDRKDKFFFVLCRTSNPGAREFQDEMYEKVAQHVATWGENCGLVVGATAPAEMKKIREITGDMTFLVPGIGAQGGSVKDVVTAGRYTIHDTRLIINSSRGIIFAEDPREEAKKLQEEINLALPARPSGGQSS